MKLGAVPYLNALPLIYYLPERPRLAPPAMLERLLRLGEVDIATAPITTLLQNPSFSAVPGIAIATQGAVQSVRLILRKPAMQLSDIRSIYLDMESRTSVLLLKVLLKFKYHLDLDRIRFITPIPQPDVDAVLLIGDKALRYEVADKDPSASLPFAHDPHVQPQYAPVARSSAPRIWDLSQQPRASDDPSKNFISSLDLGHEWTSWTDLPFVFAAWISNKPMIDARWIHILKEARDQALANLDPLLDTVTKFPRDFAASYLKNNLSYHLGEREIEGIKKFHGYAGELGLVKGDLNLRFY